MKASILLYFPIVVALSATAVAQSIEVTSTGNVGIGTASPGWPVSGFTNLDVRGSSYAGLITVSTAAADGTGLQLGQFAFVDRNTTSGLPAVSRIVSILQGSTANNRGSEMVFSTKRDNSTLTDALYIDNLQNIGIGTSSPSARLHVADLNSNLRFGQNLSSGSGGPSLMLETTDNVYADIVWNTYGSNQVRLRGSSYGLAIGGTYPRLNIGYPDAGYSSASLVVNGNVGVGTTTPGYPLQVVGSVRASSFIADVNTYSDFVFKPGYRLAPLSEVAQTIAKEGHLPGIPTEAEAKRDGIDVAQMEAKLLQKVEELTLHQIEQEKELRQLKLENCELRHQIAQVKQQ